MSEPTSAVWHWVESDHWEVQFHGLPRRFPWLVEHEAPMAASYPNPEGRQFPVIGVFLAVETMFKDIPRRRSATRGSSRSRA